jgi:hypothetical protein
MKAAQEEKDLQSEVEKGGFKSDKKDLGSQVVGPTSFADKAYSGMLELTAKFVDKEVVAVRKKLLAQPVVSFMIPLGIGEKKGAYEHVQINGWKAEVRKGQMVMIPQQVAKMLMNYLQIDQGNIEGVPHGRINRDDKVENALS